MVRSCQCGFGQQESEQDECRSKIRSHDSLRAPNDAVPPTSLDVGDGGQFSAVVTTGINAYRRANTTTTSLIFCAKLRRSHLGSGRPQSTWVRALLDVALRKAHATASVGAGGPRRDAAESLGLTEEGQRVHGRIPQAGATNPSSRVNQPGGA